MATRSFAPPSARSSFARSKCLEGDPAGMRVYVLLPDLDELLGVPGFGLRDPIRVRARQRPALNLH